MDIIKSTGQVFTPPALVRDILDFAGYTSTAILRKHIVDNSCGAGAFLLEIVARYINESQSGSKVLKTELETYIHGIELDSTAYYQCLYNLNSFVAGKGLTDVKWDIHLGDALAHTGYYGKMDYVVGNPPYVRVHNLAGSYASVKRYNFASGGMTDLYLVFFELGLRMLRPGGVLCYISPSSWINSVAGTVMRNTLLSNHNLVGIIDLGHFQAFENVTTYTMITLIQKDVAHREFEYYNMSSFGKIDKVETLTLEQSIIDNNLFLGKTEQIDTLRKMKFGRSRRLATVKNGFATLADKVFISKQLPDDPLVIPIVKASTGAHSKAIYPYDKQGKPLELTQVQKSETIYQHLLNHKAELLKGQEEKDCQWWLYGRTQALKDVWVDKWAISALIKNPESLKLTHAPSGCGVYSGLYIMSHATENNLRDLLQSEQFVNYIALLRKYKSGGYYTFNSKDLELYLNYYLQFSANHEQSSISGDYPTLF